MVMRVTLVVITSFVLIGLAIAYQQVKPEPTQAVTQEVVKYVFPDSCVSLISEIPVWVDFTNDLTRQHNKGLNAIVDEDFEGYARMGEMYTRLSERWNDISAQFADLAPRCLRRLDEGPV